MKIQIFLFVLCSAVVLVKGSANVFKKCPNDVIEHKQTVTSEACKKSFCVFKKKSSTPLKIKFTPDRNITALKHDVSARLFNTAIPWPGLPENACDSVYEMDGTTKVNCPLAAGKEYLYIYDIKILPIYPELRTSVHWGGLGEDGKNVFCFEVVVKIVN